MHLIDIYIQEVTRRLPVKSRKDIALELRSTIEDMLPENYAENEVKEALASLGNPALLASGYSDRPMHLIGPRYFDVYVTLLKMIIPLVAILTLIVVITENIITYNGEEAILGTMLSVVGHGIWGIISSSIQTFFWITLVFAIVERTDASKEKSPLTPNWKEWTPDDLKSIPYIRKEKKISKADIFGSFFWIAIFVIVYFNAFRLIGVYEKVEGKLQFVIPTFNQEVLHSYWLIVLFMLLVEVAFVFNKLIAEQWTTKVAIMNTVRTVVSTIVIIIIMNDNSLINIEFYKYLEDLFHFNFELQSPVKLGVILIWLIFAVMDVVQGFRKANIKG
ncbi:HAAS signaling domain-containing protein [Psychrobacillus sp. NPDC096426]|uniref:HAAS signaling domain-containing protein n=1 Tax=Psychrobacillus sp. NPDC096426 TaxID=3364491 RepID=UPI0038309DFD